MINMITFFQNSVILLLFFALDLSTFSFVHTPILHTLPIVTLILFLQHSYPVSLFLCFLLLSIFSCVSTGLALPYLMMIISILLVAKAASFYTTHRMLLCIGTTLIITFFSLYLFGTPFFGSYTIVSITGNLIALYFSLKWLSAVK